MSLYRVSTRYSTAEFFDFRDALELYRNQRTRGAAPVIASLGYGGLTRTENDAIDEANRETFNSNQ